MLSGAAISDEASNTRRSAVSQKSDAALKQREAGPGVELSTTTGILGYGTQSNQ